MRNAAAAALERTARDDSGTAAAGTVIARAAARPDVERLPAGLSANPILANVDVDVTWSGGHVGLWGVPPGESDLLWDDFKAASITRPRTAFCWATRRIRISRLQL